MDRPRGSRNIAYDTTDNQGRHGRGFGYCYHYIMAIRI